MAGIISKGIVATVVVLSAVLYQIEFPRLLGPALGIGRPTEPLSAFPYSCRRVYHERIQACEDAWLSESTRQLFLACSEPLTRVQWLPNMGHFNVAGRSLTDAIVVLDVDSLAADKEVKARILETPGFPGTNGDGLLHLVGFTGSDDEDGTIRLWINNLKPSIDEITGEFLNQAKHGANATIELFRTGPQAQNIVHVRTFSHPQIANPNRVAAVGGTTDAFYFTNDHGTVKTGLQHHLAPILGNGDVSYCDEESCRQVASGLKFPNGLAKGQDGLVYVPSSLLGVVDVFKPQPNGDLIKVETLETGYSLDNLSPDRDGTIYAAAIPDVLKFFAANKSPLDKDTPTTALKIVKRPDGDYEVSKVLEDGLGEILPGATTVLHDAETGRLFFTGVFAPYIGVCEPNPCGNTKSESCE